MQQTLNIPSLPPQTPLQIAHDALFRAPTAEDAQQALLDFTDVYASNNVTATSACANSTFNDNNERPSGDTALTVYISRSQETWLDMVDIECSLLSQAINSHRQATIARDTRRWNDLANSLLNGKRRIISENEILKASLQRPMICLGESGQTEIWIASKRTPSDSSSLTYIKKVSI